MNSRKSLLLIALAAALALSSCSGLKNPCTINCGSGDALISITMSDTPPTNTSVVSFTLPVIGVALVPSSGSQAQVFSSGSFELTRLQSDTSLVVTNVKVAAGSYTAVNVTVSAPSGVYVNSSTNTYGTCLPQEICSITGAATTITYTFPTALTLSANAKQWVNLDFNYNNAIVTTKNVVGIDMTQTGVMTASSTVPTGVTSGNFANVDDFTGQIAALSSSSITVTSQLRGSVTATINSATQWFDPQSQCTGGGSITCVQTGSVVSLQGLLSTSGVVNATSVDVIDKNPSPTDEVEGMIYPSLCNGAGSYGMILSDSVINTSGSPLAGSSYGSGVCLTIGGTALFVVDTGILTGQSGAPTGNRVPGFSGTGDLIAGQTIRAQITGTTTGTNGYINATATEMLLRFSRLTGTVSTASSSSFSITNLPPYLGTTFTVPPTVITYPNATLLENVASSSVGNLSGTVSMNALYLNVSGGAQYWFQAAKVRQQ